MTTAQDLFASAMRERLRSRKEALGFGCAASKFTLPSHTHFATIGLQKSTSSDRLSLKFTANITVVGKQKWQASREERPYLPERPAPNTGYGEPAWQTRIGSLTPEGQELWWTISTTSEANQSIDHLAQLVEAYALPAMSKRLSEYPGCP